jgi:hypothetical protein
MTVVAALITEYPKFVFDLITKYPKFVIDLSVSMHISYNYDKAKEKRISGCFGSISSHRFAYLDLYLHPVELSSDGGTQGSLRLRDVDAELREIRLSLLMEIEKRKQIEESIKSMQSQWERIREGLSSVGIVLPADLSAIAEGGRLDSDPVDDLCQQVYIARFISNAIGRGTARAEAETEMKTQLDSKNFEISRLLERLHYYETMNREMSQRNQEAVGEIYVNCI